MSLNLENKQIDEKEIERRILKRKENHENIVENKENKVVENEEKENIQIEDKNVEEAQKSPEEIIKEDLMQIFLDSDILDVFQNKFEYDENVLNKIKSDIEKFIDKELIQKQIDKKLDPKKMTKFIYNVYRPYVKKLSGPFLEQEAYNISNKIFKYLEDK